MTVRRATPWQPSREIVGDGRGLVVLGSCTDRASTNREFEAYAPLVPVGSYVVVTDTIVNGHPVWPAFGPGPAEAVKQVLSRHGEFVADPADGEVLAHVQPRRLPPPSGVSHQTMGTWPVG